jgi:hypothetical protein
MADETITEADPASRPALPDAPALSARGAALLKAALKAGPLPTKAHEARTAFGRDYPEGTYVDTTDQAVQELVFALRGTGATYRTIAVAIGAQCSALTERAARAHARRANVADGWQAETGGRATKAAVA